MSGGDFLGVGWNFPVTTEPGGQIALTSNAEDNIRQSIWLILSTTPGERVMRPDFGCGLTDLVFGVNNAGTASAVASAVRESLATWEPRIDILDVYAAPDPQRPNVLLVEINYAIRANNSRFNLVYPFYLE
jgi:uncharacterized protein